MDIVDLYGELTEFINDPQIEEIWINSPTRIYVARNGVPELTTRVIPATKIHQLVERLLLHTNRRVDLSHPFVDATLPDGSRLHVAIPTVTSNHWAINIRKHLLRTPTLGELVQRGMLSSLQSIELKALVEQGKSFLISGGTHTGKTTLLNALLSESPPQTRLITAEEVFELSPDVPDMINMQCRESVQAGEAAIDLRRLVKESLRMRPTRLVIGEVRGAEALELLIALNSGVPGAASIHANSAAEAIEKLTLLPMLAGENFPLLFVKQLVNRAIDVVIHLAIDPISGKRKIEEIFQVAKVIEE